MSYRNSEGYADPTAGAVMSKMMYEYRQARKEELHAENEAKRRKRIYVVSPYAGDTEKNTAAAVRYCRFVIQQGCMPVASHLMYPAILNDRDTKERLLGTSFGLVLLKYCHEVWVFGETRSTGMKREIGEARRLGRPVRYFSSQLKEV